MKLINNKCIDMHTHSIYSDGELEVEELIRRAIDKAIEIIVNVVPILFPPKLKL